MKNILLGFLICNLGIVFLFSQSTQLGLNNIIASKKVEKISDEQKLKIFTSLIYENNPKIKSELIAKIDKEWEAEFVPVLAEFVRLSNDQKFVRELIHLLRKKTGQKFGNDPMRWIEWLWENPPAYGSYYADFKGNLYQHIDHKFKKYFRERQASSKIRIDEIVWGGVRQDGIPPLRNPALIDATAADYLGNNDVVFGFYINGEAKAYPKRILAWHEFFTDTFGDDKVAGVYCTLCGTVIAYDMIFNGTFHDLGTSGFLYRSNKLMYDKETQSLWNTIEGAPVVGPLADKGIQLETFPVVTTTWGEWKKLHPETKVLAIPREHVRDYSEGAAYSDYFATDELMFPVPKADNRLANKAEVLIIRAPNYRQDPLAISIEYLRRKKWYRGKIKDTNFIVLADKSGVRAFDIQKIDMVNFKKGQLKDAAGNTWQIKGNELVSSNNQVLPQLDSHNIFWFAWFNSYPETRLVK